MALKRVAACRYDMNIMELLPLRDIGPVSLACVKEIYEEAFPAWEREDFEQLLVRGADEGSQQYACFIEDQVVGFATISILQSVGWNFLEHFALAQDYRSKGLGSRFWSHIYALLKSPVVIEVESPEQPGIHADEVCIRQDRIRFWRRAGFDQIPVPNYRVPRSDNGDFELLLLMTNMPPVRSPEALTAALYAEGYGLVDAQKLAAIAMEPQISDRLLL